MTGNGGEPRLRMALAEAETAARTAYRDTARLIRLLTVIGTQSSPGRLVERTLVVLSEVFTADVTCVAEVVDGRLLVTGSCGLPEDDPAFSDGWPLGPVARKALEQGTAVDWAEVADDELPPTLRGSGSWSGAWIPISVASDPSDDLLILYRRSGEAFTVPELQVLLSVGYRLATAVEARERGVAIERLAEAGPDLARHLDPTSLLPAAAALLRRLTGTEAAWILSVEGDTAALVGQAGLTETTIRRWPRPVTDLPTWPAIRRGEPFVGPCRIGESDPSAEDPGLSGEMMLCVPVMRDGAPIAVLGATGRRARSFGKTAVEVSTILANYLSVAIANGELYRALAGREEELRLRATHDPLTGLANRTLAHQSIENALTRSGSGTIGLIFCDLDNFKEVNDRLGHEAGDELIQQVADRLATATRRDDVLARFGGDEFVFVLPNVESLADLSDVGRRIQFSLADPFWVRGSRLGISASVGGVLGRRGESSPTVMLRDADAAMYAAKGKGPGQVEVFDDEASHRSVANLDLRSELPQALARGQLSVVYQPIVRLETQEVAGFEALVRWIHPERGPVPPDVFIPMAEETGAIVPIGAWVLRHACEHLARWQRLAPQARLNVSVNMSAVQLERPEEDLLDIITSAGVDPSDVWLEVTERVNPVADITEPVAALRRAGVHFALDDFGMSYSSLTYLQRFPVECLKIDKSFVKAMNDSEAERGIVRAILAVAGSLAMRVVAEGIETQTQLDTLVELGCGFGQGYLLFRPMSTDQCAQILLG